MPQRQFTAAQIDLDESLRADMDLASHPIVASDTSGSVTLVSGRPDQCNSVSNVRDSILL